MSTQADRDQNLVATLTDVEDGDRLTLETAHLSWQSIAIIDTDLTTKSGAEGAGWTTGVVRLEGGRGTNYIVDLDSERERPAKLYRLDDPDAPNDARHDHYGNVKSVDYVDETEHTCEDCGATFDTARGLGGHRGRPENDCGDGQDLEDWRCSECDHTSTSSRGVNVHIAKTHDGDAEAIGPGDEAPEDNEEDEEIDVALPDGVTIDDVHDLVDEHEFLDNLAAELNENIRRARAIVFALDRYVDVSEARHNRGAYRERDRR